LLVCEMMVLSYLVFVFFFFFNDTATTEIYTLSLHDALPIFRPEDDAAVLRARAEAALDRAREAAAERLSAAQ